MKKAGKSFKWLVLLIPVHILLLLYFLLAVYYNHKFSLGTWINGIYCTGKSVEEVNGLLIANTVLPDITVTDMEGKVEVISLEDIDCRIDYTVHLKEFIRKQNPFLWGLRLLTPEAAQVRPMIFCDRDVLIEKIDGLSVVRKGRTAGAPKAEIMKTEQGFILEENLSGIPDAEKITQLLLEEIEEGQEEIILPKDCYEERPITAEMAEVFSLWEKVEALQNCGIIYDMGDVQVPVDSAVVGEWIAADEDGSVIVDEEGNPVLKENCFKTFIDSLAEEFDTYNVPREFQSTRGDAIRIEKGTYGNRLDRKAETAYLEKAFFEKKKEIHVPVYDKEALYRGKDDIGDTYIEVDMTEQVMYYYADGELEVETPVVTGNLKTGHGTPARICSVYLKQTDRILRGPGYASPVKFWMPVYGNIGIHDASWRSQFGGGIYKTNGSHGCINTPYDAMKTIFDEVEVGTPVIMFY